MNLTDKQIEKLHNLLVSRAQEGFTHRVYFSETGMVTVAKEHNLQAWSQENFVWRSSGQYWQTVPQPS